jgi:hypothetical protein
MILDRDEDPFPRAVQLPAEFDDDSDPKEIAVEMPPLTEQDRIGMTPESVPVIMRPLSLNEMPTTPCVKLDVPPCKGMDEPAINDGMKLASKRFSDDWLRLNKAKLRRPWDGVDLS